MKVGLGRASTEAVVVASLSTGLNLNLRPVGVKDMEEGEGTMGLSMLLVLAVCLLSFKVLRFI